jgi:hypothetical protein
VANVRGFFQKAFPFISAGLSLGGPVGNAAALILGKAIGKPELTADGVDDALSNLTLSQEQQVELKKAELAFQQQMAEAGFKNASDLADIAEKDRDSARQRETQVKDLTPRVLGGGVILGFLISVFMVLSGHAKADSVISGTLIGYLSAKAELVLAYYFGSSASSDRKTEIIANGNGNSNPH